MSKHQIMFAGALRTQSEIAHISGVSRTVLQRRLNAGESIDQAVLPRPRKPQPKRKDPSQLKKRPPLQSGRKPSVRYVYNGLALTAREIATISGLSERVIRTRIYLGWPIKDVVETPLDVARVGLSDEERRWKWRTERWRSGFLSLARSRSKTKVRTLEDAPIEFDPWSQAAIDAAVAEGGWTLDVVGKVMGGLTRERVRQVEDRAFRKIRRAVPNASKAEIVDLLRGLDQSGRRQDPFELEIPVGHDWRGKPKKVKEAKP